MTRSVYVAGASGERDMVGRYMAGLRSAGLVVAFDWVASRNACETPEGDLPDDVARDIAHRCFRGVEACDIFWLLAPQMPSEGAWTELGHALKGRKSAVVISGPARTVFARCASQRFPTHEHALDAIVRGAVPCG